MVGQWAPKSEVMIRGILSVGVDPVVVCLHTGAGGTRAAAKSESPARPELYM